MATYEYRAKDGELITVERPMTRAPRIGSTLTRNGKTYRRIPSSNTQGQVQPDLHFVSRSLPRAPKHDSPWREYHNDFDAQGRPRFSSRHQVEEAVAKHNWAEDTEMTYGSIDTTKD